MAAGIASLSQRIPQGLRECRPNEEKCRKECFGKCRPQTGCRGKWGCRGKCLKTASGGSLILIHLHCWEVLPFLTMRRQRCIKILCPKDPEFYTPLALNCQKGKHLPALEVYRNQSPIGSPRLCYFRQRRGPEALFRHNPQHHVWNRHFPKHSFRHFSWLGLWHFFRWSALS